MSAVTRSRGWLLTQSAEKMSVQECIDLLDNSLYPYVFQVEQGKEDGYKHYQIYIEALNPVKFTTIKNRFKNAHIEARRGSKAQAYNYCSKEDTRLEGPFWGNGDIDITDVSGSRTDLVTLREMVFAGVPMAEILVNEPSACNYMRYLDRLLFEHSGLKHGSSFREVEVTYLWGPTGSGKTSKIYNDFDFSEIFRVTDYDHPFDGYAGQDVLVLDEFHGQLSASLMLNIMDRYPLQLPARYNNIWAGFTKVFVISNLVFTELYPNVQIEKPAVFAAIKRRIHNFVYLENINDNKR